jgi:hypothetical protein
MSIPLRNISPCRDVTTEQIEKDQKTAIGNVRKFTLNFRGMTRCEHIKRGFSNVMIKKENILLKLFPLKL